MKILHLDSGRSLRGGQVQVEMLAKGLSSAAGIEQRVLAAGVLRERLGAAALGAATLRRDAAWADLIHAHDARSHSIAAALAGGTPLVVSRRVAFPPKSGIVSRWKYRRPALFLAVSEYVRGRLIEAGIPGDRIRVVYDGAHPPVQEPIRRSSTGPLRVLALDSTDPGKGTALAREACLEANLPLTLTADLRRDLDAHDAFLYLSENEGLGSALIAAAMSKTPVVASRVGGIPEVVQHEKTGLLTSNDPAEIGLALRRLAADRALAQRLAEAAFHRAMREFTADIMVARTIDAYRSILNP